MLIRNVAVFCASASGADPAYQIAAEDLGRALAAHTIGIIYGGAKVGLMCAVAESALAHGGRVVGVIPEVLVDLEVADHGITELHVVDTMHTRKALMGAESRCLSHHARRFRNARRDVRGPCVADTEAA